MFSRSEFFLNFKIKTLLLKVFYQKCHKCVKVSVLKGLKFWEKLRKNKYICKFIPSLIHEIWVWAIFRANVVLMTSPRCVKNFKILRERLHKRITHVKVSFTFDVHLSVNIGTWNTNFWAFWPSFGLMMSPRGVKTLKLWDNGFKNKYFTSIFPLLSTFIFLSPLVYEIQVWVLFVPILG